jgi:hypothetical protein
MILEALQILLILSIFDNPEDSDEFEDPKNSEDSEEPERL